jgi:hypothetical protein
MLLSGIGTWRDFDSLYLCLVLNALALVLNVLAENLDALKCWWLGVFIAPTTKVAVGEGYCRRKHQTVRCTTGHCPVRQPRHPTVRVRPLELLTCGPLDSPVVHRIGHVHCPVRHLAPALTLRAQSTLFTVHCSCCRRPLAQVAVAPLGTPDSPVNYSRVAPRIPEGGKFGVDLPGAPDIVRWHTGLFGAPDQGCLRLSFALFI